MTQSINLSAGDKWHGHCTHSAALSIRRNWGQAMSPQWHFIQDDQDQWRWKRIDESYGDVDSSASFESEIECIMDAMRYAVTRRRAGVVYTRDDHVR